MMSVYTYWGEGEAKKEKKSTFRSGSCGPGDVCKTFRERKAREENAQLNEEERNTIYDTNKAT